MSDLIERLRREGYTIGGWGDALLELEAQQAEIARLRAALEPFSGLYVPKNPIGGTICGLYSVPYSDILKARTELEQKP